MPASTVQLVKTGIQDIALTGSPEVNLFKHAYYRYANFATETVKLYPKESMNFGKRGTFSIPKVGHLLSKLHMHIRVPALAKIDGTYVSWADTLGYSIFDGPLELDISGVKYDRLYPEFMDMRSELSSKFGSSDSSYGFNAMIARGDSFKSTMHNAEKMLDLMVPLDFWFTHGYESSLPIFAMEKDTITINFKFKEFVDLIHYDGATEPVPVNVQLCDLYAEYIYLDQAVIDSMPQELTYLITQTQYTQPESVQQSVGVHNSSLKMTNPIKELIFACVDNSSVESNNHFAYSGVIDTVTMYMDGQKRFDKLPEMYCRTVFPQSVHTNISTRHIYVLPFCTNADVIQPTGTFNASRFADVILQLTLVPSNAECRLHVFAVSYNLVSISRGQIEMKWFT